MKICFSRVCVCVCTVWETSGKKKCSDIWEKYKKRELVQNPWYFSFVARLLRLNFVSKTNASRWQRRRRRQRRRWRRWCVINIQSNSNPSHGEREREETLCSMESWRQMEYMKQHRFLWFLISGQTLNCPVSIGCVIDLFCSCILLDF